MPGKARTSSSPKHAPNVPLMRSIGASVPPDVPEPSAIHQMTSLAMHERGQRAEREPTGEHVVDDVVADAEGAWHEQPERRPHQRADDRVPERRRTAAAGTRFDQEQPLGDHDGQQAAGEPESGEQRELAEAAEAVRRHREQRPVAEQQRVHAAGDARRRRPAGRTRAARTRTAAARSRARRRRAACRTSPPFPPPRHTRAGSCARWRDVDELTDERPDRPTGDDDRAFGAERAAGADGDRRRQWLRDGSARGHLAAARVSTASIASGMPWPRMIGDHLASNVTTAPPAMAVRTTSGPMSSVA